MNTPPTDLTGSHALAKASQHPSSYALKIRTGEVIHFESAEILNPQWIHLAFPSLQKQRDRLYQHQPDPNDFLYQAPHGIDVRLSDIVWVVDDPYGSG